VTLLLRGGELKASRILQEQVLSHPQVDVRFHTEVVGFQGEGRKLKSVTIKSNQTRASEEIHPAAVFVFIGQIPNTEFLSESNVQIDRWGFIVTGHALLHEGGRPDGYDDRDPYPLETSVPGIFAAGDARAGSTKQVASAAGEGTTAALLIREYLESV
jgi:thioredoxin reductase (NADPH)